MRKLVYIIIGLAIIVAVVWTVSRPDPIMISVDEVRHGLVEWTVANTRAGTVHACRRARMAPQVGGQIAKLLVNEGDAVTRNQILLELWNDDLTEQIKLAEKDLLASRARADQSCISADVASREASRLRKLRKQKLASEESTDRAVGDALAKKAACKASRASIEVSRARYDVARANLERTILRSPFNGTVAEINGELGEFITPSPIGVATLPAVDVIDNSCLYVKAPIDEVDSPNIVKEMLVRISLDAYSGQLFSGTVRRVSTYVLDLQKQARTMDVEVDFDAPDKIKGLLPGYSADVEIIIDSKKDVLRIPTESLLEGKQVYVFNADNNTLSLRDIKTGLSNWKYTEVTAGLVKGESIVTSIDRKGIKDGVSAVIEAEEDSAVK
ncbi:MAG: efflux RND transporter periplasmic adaptor subunit [Gammaproteobacteria bacterium]|nr:MAG: efflux RND transporter periplasmic adaptor subunit [Gammaproteobacteria bacterium]